MSVTRRKTIALVGGGTVLAMSAGAAAFLATRAPVRARAPWDAAGGYEEPRLRALSYALLAPNPHNLQPWRAALEGPDTIRLYRDPTRRLPQTDPFDRQLVIGMGCFLELLAMAAAADGLAADVALFPEGEDVTAPVAIVALRDGGTADPLFTHVLSRRTCREPFEHRRVPDALLARVLASAAPAAPAFATGDPDEVAWLRDLTHRAWEIEATTPETLGETVALTRIGRREIETNPDGISLGGGLIEALALAGVMTREQMATPGSAAFQATLDFYHSRVAATPAFVWVKTAGNARTDQIAAGRSWVRVNLAATGLGLALHPVSQALQEFAQMAEPYGAVQSRLAAEGETVQMLGRIGYGPRVPPSPRWPLETRLTHARG